MNCCGERRGFKIFGKVFCFILLFVLSFVFLTGCTDKKKEDKFIAEFTDDSGVTYGIYSSKAGGSETFYAKVTAVADNTHPSEISVSIPQKVTYEGVEYSVKVIGDLAFYRSNYDIIHIPEGVTAIEKFAFDRAKATIINLPSTITSIGEYAFLDCVSLRDIYLKSEVPPVLGAYAFMVYDTNTGKYINSSILAIHVPTTAKKRYTDINNYPHWEDYQGNIR